MLVVELNRANYEYDVNSIVKAFYPEEQITVLTPESREDKREKLRGNVRIRVVLDKEGAQLGIGEKEYRWDRTEAEDPKLGDVVNSFRDTVRSEGPEYTVEDSGTADEKEYKYGFKCFLYRILRQETGKELPWGNLTGIRPTKIAYQLLEQGACEQEIIDHYMEKYYVSREKAKLSVDIARRERELLSGLCGPDNFPGEGPGDKSQVALRTEDGRGNGQVCSQSGDRGNSRDCDDSYSLYIGIPFCPSTCMYCSFTSFPIAAYRHAVDAYLDCVIREMEFVAQRYGDRRLDCVYIGGGTPTTLEAGQLERLLKGVRNLFNFTHVKEFTVEAGRADSITEEKLQVLRRYGVDRISVNPQTMRQETLDLIGRKASVEQVEEAYGLARKLGFDNINMDLILGLPGELETDVQRTVDRVVEMAPDSLTVHSLAIKRASRLNRWVQERGVAMLRNTDETMGIAAEGAKRLGLVPYYLYRQKNMSGNFENVGYAREGKLGLYNILIMEEVQTIVALGAGAISKRVHPDGLIERCENVKEVSQYIERIDEMIERKRQLLGDR